MKKCTGFLLALLCSSFAHAAAHDGVLFEVTKSKIVPATQVGDSVFYYETSELTCDSDGDEETPCLATVDHWQTVCFEGKLEAVCPAFESLFAVSRDQLMNDGAEEDVELVSCSSESGITVMTYNLLSFHGGPNVQLKEKMIPMCPIFFK